VPSTNEVFRLLGGFEIVPPGRNRLVLALIDFLKDFHKTQNAHKENIKKSVGKWKMQLREK
jgi:hypothetical protein